MKPDRRLDDTLALAALTLALRRAEACDWMHRTFPRRGLTRLDGEPTGAALVRAMREASVAEAAYCEGDATNA